MGLKVENLSFSYGTKSVLKDISFEVKPGELLGLLGPNGVGKTTLLKCINKIHLPSMGAIYIQNQRVDQLKEKELAHHLSYVPQSTHSSFPVTTMDMVMIGRLPFINFKVRQEDKTLVFDLIRDMGLADMAFSPINRLSGGEHQRVFIARAIAQEPKVILLDEPTSNLDMGHQIDIMKLLKRTLKEKNIAAVMTVHDLNLAGMFCDQVLMLKDQQVFAYGPCEAVITEENIQEVFGVATEVHPREGKHHVLLLDASR